MSADYMRTLIKLNLSFFEKDGKTEEPTSKRVEDARNKGNVAKSQEVGTAALFLVMFIALQVFAPSIFNNMKEVFVLNFSLIEQSDQFFKTDVVVKHIYTMFGTAILMAAPILAVALIVGVVTNIWQVGWKITTEPLKPKFSKLNPISGFKRIFSVHSLVTLGKSLAKFAVIVYAIYSTLIDKLYLIPLLINMELYEAVVEIAALCVDMGIKVGMYFVVIAYLDRRFTKHKHHEGLKMTKQEVKDEYKNSEGDPKVKGQQRQRMRQAAMRRMMSDVPTADVIITNPTHFAVAIKYDRTKSDAPFVVAKGMDHVARRIKEVAVENKVQIVEDKPLARSLYAAVDIGQAIPPELYQAVAEILAFVYRLRENNIS